MAESAAGLLTLTFDDGLLCQFEIAYPLLQRHAVRGVAFVPTGLVGDWYEGQRSMDLGHLRELAAAGWEIGSHTVSHAHFVKEGRTRLPLATIEAEVRESREWLITHGFPAIAFAYPYGRYNDETEAVARRYYRYIRTVEDGLNDVAPAHARLKVIDLCQKKIHRWRPAVDAARASGRWLIAMIHSVVPSAEHIPAGRESFAIAVRNLGECLEYALAAGLAARTFQDVYDACQRRSGPGEGTGGSPPTPP